MLQDKLRSFYLTLFLSGLLACVASGHVFGQTGEIIRDCDVCPELIVLPTGEAPIGSPPDELDRDPDEGPVHVRQITTVLAMGIYEVTNAEYAAFVSETQHETERNCRTLEGFVYDYRNGRYWRSPGFAFAPRNPVVCLQWRDVVAYLQWLREKTGKDYRLPSEIEWEFAARAGTTTRYWFGDDLDSSLLCQFANVAYRGITMHHYIPESVCHDGYDRVAPVGSFPANDFGLYDMIGNVFEWTTDCYIEKNPYQPGMIIIQNENAGCRKRSLRGGSWWASPKYTRTANRGTHRFFTQSSSVGFRVVRSYGMLVSQLAPPDGDTMENQE